MKIIPLLFAALATLALVPDSGAVGTTYPGSICQSASNHDSYGLNSSRARNLSATSTLTLDCPVAAPDFEMLGSAIFIRDRHPTLNATCSWVGLVATVSGNLGFISTASTAGASTTPQELNFGAFPTSTNRFFFFGCTLPPTSNGAASEIVAAGTVFVP